MNIKSDNQIDFCFILNDMSHVLIFICKII